MSVCVVIQWAGGHVGDSIERDVFDLGVFSRLHCAAKRLGYFLLKNTRIVLYTVCARACVCVCPFTYCTALYCNSSTHVSNSWIGHNHRSVPSQDTYWMCPSVNVNSFTVTVSQRAGVDVRTVFSDTAPWTLTESWYEGGLRGTAVTGVKHTGRKDDTVSPGEGGGWLGWKRTVVLAHEQIHLSMSSRPHWAGKRLLDSIADNKCW